MPFTEKAAGNDIIVEALWDLVNGLTELRQKLPNRNEAVGWCNSVESWAAILRDKVTDFPEVFDGTKLAEYVEKKTRDADSAYGRLTRLQTLLQREESAIIWLNRFCGFLKTNGFGEVLRTLSIILDQSGFLDKLSNLHRDQGISETLKDIAESLEWNIRDYLRDTRITALAEEVGAGDWDDDHVVQELIKKLQERAENNPDAAFAEASVRLFAWIVERKSWELLRGFPVFGRRIDRERPLTVVHLPINDQVGDRPMAPVKVWAKDLQSFADLFPPTRILADAFFDALPNLSAWQTLAEKAVVGTEIIISSNTHFSKFYPALASLREGVEHSTVDLVPVTDVWRRPDIMERVRDSQDRARLFWRFLTEWLSPKDLKSLEAEQAQCRCGDEHRYYPAAWIEPLRENSWVRQGNDIRTFATAQSLANLLRGSHWDSNSLNENPAAVKLLEAMGISRFDLLREFVATNDESRREVDNAFINMLATAGSNVSHLNHARQYIEDLKADAELPAVLAERREQRRRIHRNQQLGDSVEELVKQSLKGAGFTVQRTRVGSDFRIEYDDVTRLKLAKSGRTWWVEVKATRGSDGVAMTPAQAETAVIEGDGFLLCVVPVVGETADLELDDVRGNMRFVQNIGPRVAPLCSNLDDLDALRNDIMADAPQGVQLEVVPGTARFRVASSVWQNDGFPLAELSNRLK